MVFVESKYKYAKYSARQRDKCSWANYTHLPFSREVDWNYIYKICAHDFRNWKIKLISSSKIAEFRTIISVLFLNSLVTQYVE